MLFLKTISLHLMMFVEDYLSTSNDVCNLSFMVDITIFEKFQNVNNQL